MTGGGGGGGGGGCGEAFLLVLFFLPVRASSTAIFHDVISIVSWSIMLRTIGSILLGVGGWGGSKGGRLGGGRLGGGVYEEARAPPVGEASAAVFKDRSDDCLSLLRRARADVYVTALL